MTHSTNELEETTENEGLESLLHGPGRDALASLESTRKEWSHLKDTTYAWKFAVTFLPAEAKPANFTDMPNHTDMEVNRFTLAECLRNYEASVKCEFQDPPTIETIDVLYRALLHTALLTRAKVLYSTPDDSYWFHLYHQGFVGSMVPSEPEIKPTMENYIWGLFYHPYLFDHCVRQGTLDALVIPASSTPALPNED